MPYENVLYRNKKSESSSIGYESDYSFSTEDKELPKLKAFKSFKEILSEERSNFQAYRKMQKRKKKLQSE
jgi:hypothetical protein